MSNKTYSYDYFKSNKIPQKIYDHLSSLYKSSYSSSDMFFSFNKRDELNAFVIYDDLIIKHIFIFTISTSNVYISNSLLSIEDHFLDLFCNFIFDKFAQVSHITLRGLRHPINNLKRFKSLVICEKFSQDYIIYLPKNVEDYKKTMGKKTRQHTNNYISRLNKNFSKFEFITLEPEQISPSIVSKIIGMNRQRMIKKGTTSGIDLSYENKLIQFASKRGFIGLLKLNDQIVAGTLCSKVENNYFLQVISNDPEYDSFNVGHTCLFLTIKNCIELNGSEFHLLWGNSEYKKRFLGVSHDLYAIDIFRKKLNKNIFLFSNYLKSITLNNLKYKLKKLIKICSNL